MNRLTYPAATIFHHRSIGNGLYSSSDHHHQRSIIPPGATASGLGRRKAISTLLAAAAVGWSWSPAASWGYQEGEPETFKWGTRSFLWEHFFEPGLSPEDAAVRIRNTREGFHAVRHMLDTMAWRYLLFFVRLKAKYLKQDMKAALATVDRGRRPEYIKTANELIDNMAELDYYVRTPKVYESYVFYEKTLKSLDTLVALLV